MRWDDPQIQELIDLALREDIGECDVTTEACVPSDAVASGFFLPQQSLTLAGTPLLRHLYDRNDVEILCGDGDSLRKGQVFARVRGPARRLLTLERTALNLLQRTCGIATLASRYVSAIEGTGCILLDTRKTQPGMRLIDKLAVRAGGGTNHRLGLYDAVLIKNNHIAAAGGVQEAVARCSSSGLPVEVEVRNGAELDQALASGVRHVLLDNFPPEKVARAVDRIAGRAKIEVSGNITLSTIRAYAEAGADFASVGALTHSAPAADISFRLE
jgi:nicotinate-nucleotide pyrophosphorylase (carboxylating)